MPYPKTMQMRTHYFEWSQIPLFMTAGEVCQLFGITRQTLINWETSLGLPAEHMGGGKTMYSKSRLIEWIENGYRPLPSTKQGDELPGLRAV